ncbi:hypothetical protein PENTCL1PPCAC_6042, partial [Pristionchus entomophagus]
MLANSKTNRRPLHRLCHPKLNTHIEKNGPINDANASSCKTGINYMHKLGLVHRNLKMDNILIFAPNTVKITDFGL